MGVSALTVSHTVWSVVTPTGYTANGSATLSSCSTRTTPPIKYPDDSTEKLLDRGGGADKTVVDSTGHTKQCVVVVG